MQKKLINWFIINKRDLPWRNSNDPYKIWLSEVIFQQTRIEQGLSYYQKFISDYPKVELLANASQEEVYKNWQGLGYYSRANNLHKTAKIITEKYGGKFPKDSKEINALPGIGEYTTAAISSFAFQNPLPLVDGNVFRLYSRVFKEKTPINSTDGKKIFKKIALKLITELSSKEACVYNEAIMEFGALVCSPKPKCSLCPIQSHCLSFADHSQKDFPVKIKKKKSTTRTMSYVVVYNERGFWVKKRAEKDIWQHLYDFPSQNDLKKEDVSKIEFSKIIKHKLTHRNLEISMSKLFLSIDTLKGFEFIPWSQKDEFAYPQPLKLFLDSFFSF
ncbi:MAG: A/G-specific adenine glycosylase [Flavobacteriales bacterium]|jgi:A/G-specific adenine glycosylase|nr:A/G-specific adenine glycosylase [Flavobacteriales bacterium]